jgi:arabinofuranan 3-O-arabinosyltransferase
VVSVDGHRFRTTVTAAPASLLDGLSAPASLCTASGGAVDLVGLRAGENDVSADASATFAPDVLVLGEHQVAEGSGPVVDAARSRTATRRVLDPTSGAEVVVLHENENAGWRAEQGGQTLRPFVADGWQQGFSLADDAAPVDVTFTPDRLYRWGLLLGLLAALGLVAAVAVPSRRRSVDPASAGERTLPATVVLGTTVVGCGLVAGWAGLLVGSLAAVATITATRRFPDQAPWVLAAPVLVAAGAYALRPWGGATGWAGQLVWAQLLVLVPLAAVLAAAAGPVRSRFSRRAGRSTSR